MPLRQRASRIILNPTQQQNMRRACRWQRWSVGDMGKRGNSDTTSAATDALSVANVRPPPPRNRNPSAMDTAAWLAKLAAAPPAAALAGATGHRRLRRPARGWRNFDKVSALG